MCGVAGLRARGKREWRSSCDAAVWKARCFDISPAWWRGSAGTKNALISR